MSATNSKKRSDIWNYFESKSDKVVCKLCNREFTNKYNNTSNFRLHLKTVHSEVFKPKCQTDIR